MTIIVRSSNRAYLSPNVFTSMDKYLHASANLLVFNPPTVPVIEIREGSLSLELQEKVVFSVTGDAKIIADDKQQDPWKASIAQKTINLSTDRVAYLAIKGLTPPTNILQPLKPETMLTAVNPSNVPEKILMALKVPQVLRISNSDWLESISRLQRHISLVTDAVQRGAELVRIKINGGEFEAWVLELE